MLQLLLYTYSYGSESSGFKIKRNFQEHTLQKPWPAWNSAHAAGQDLRSGFPSGAGPASPGAHGQADILSPHSGSLVIRVRKMDRQRRAPPGAQHREAGTGSLDLGQEERSGLPSDLQGTFSEE